MGLKESDTTERLNNNKYSSNGLKNVAIVTIHCKLHTALLFINQ